MARPPSLYRLAVVSQACRLRMLRIVVGLPLAPTRRGDATGWRSAAKKLVLGLPNGVYKPVQTDRTTKG